MGLFRLFWIPEGRNATEGTYVYYPHTELLDVLALEASRAGAYVVGEDLGTVEPWVRDELSRRGVLSYRLWWFEPQRPPSWPEAALGSVTTHDLPTVAGVWTGADLAAQRSLDLHPNEEGAAAMRQRLASWTGSHDDTPIDELITRTYGALSEAPCRLLTASLDDACEREERPNFPGTTDEWPNWRLALPLPLEELTQLPTANGIAAQLSRTHAAGSVPPPAF
jgi:4-alpha-glucanotransferase